MLRSTVVVVGLTLGWSGGLWTAAVASTYSFAYSGGGRPVSIAGDFTTDASGTIEDLTGSVDGVSILSFSGGRYLVTGVGDPFLAANFSTATTAYTLAPFGRYAVVYVSGVPTSFGTVSVSTIAPSAVPLPSSAPMFGAALMSLGTIGYGLKRTKARTSPVSRTLSPSRRSSREEHAARQGRSVQ